MGPQGPPGNITGLSTSLAAIMTSGSRCGHGSSSTVPPPGGAAVPDERAGKEGTREGIKTRDTLTLFTI